MTELKHLLALALDEVHVGTVPVEDDLVRGRRLLRRRTRIRMMVGGVAAAAAAVAVIMPIASGGRGASGARATTGSRPAVAPGTAGIKLVDYTGAQPPGYTVKTIPDHWVIQGSTPFALTIAPANA